MREADTVVVPGMEEPAAERPAAVAHAVQRRRMTSQNTGRAPVARTVLAAATKLSRH